jgi:hypothetical protein
MAGGGRLKWRSVRLAVFAHGTSSGSSCALLGQHESALPFVISHPPYMMSRFESVESACPYDEAE